MFFLDHQHFEHYFCRPFTRNLFFNFHSSIFPRAQGERPENMSVIGSQPSSHTLRFSEEDHDTQIGLLKLEEAGASLVGTGSGTTVVVGKKEDGSYVATYQVVVPNLPLATPENSGSRKEITYNIAGLIDVSAFLSTKQLFVEARCIHDAPSAWRCLQMAHAQNAD